MVRRYVLGWGRRYVLGWGICLCATMIFVGVMHAASQEVSNPPARGVRHLLEVTIKSDPNSQFLQQGIGDDVTATLTVKIRISDHSREAHFYGDVSKTISDFDPIKGSNAQAVWFDTQCHHERGIPKVTLIGVEGSATNGEKKIPIKARTRRIGLLLPGDEVMASRRLDSGSDKVGPFIATRTETRQSHLFVDMKLYILPCELAAGLR